MDKENTSTAKDDIQKIAQADFDKRSRSVTKPDINTFCNKVNSVKYLHTMSFDETFTFEDAIKVLREHNLSGKSVNNLTGGLLYERPLMLAFLEEVENKLAWIDKAERLLRAAVEDMNIEDLCDKCNDNALKPNCPPIANCFEWIHKHEVDELLFEL